MKNGVECVLLVIALMLACLWIGVSLGKKQSDVIDKHVQMELDGYNYCPYCGIELNEQ